MPARLPEKFVNRYFVVPPEQPAHYLRGFPSDQDGEIKSPWLADHPDLFGWLQSLHSGQKENRTLRIPGIMSLPEFFDEVSPLRPPFMVFKCDGFAGPNLKRLWCESKLEPIQAALDEVRPFEWDQWDTRQIRESRSMWGHSVTCYLFGSQLWTLTTQDKAAAEDELRLLFLEAHDKDRQRFERLRRKFSGAAGAQIEVRREPIPEDVRIYVWRRDGGRCVRCGSQERLEYDHVIPVIKGGSNTERNIQLLCETCNRKKSDSI